nr:RHS repeat-associated core domain-containing protein [Methylosinus sp. Sm6]
MPDHLGAPHEIVNAANQRVWLWDHDPFGNGAPVAAAGFSHDLRFPGQIYDSETRLHNNGFRDYSPALGRYVETDPIGLEGGINTYAYANNNPLNAVDPTGTLVTPETYVWDIPNVVMGLVSLFDNLFHGNFASAGIDAAGLGVDVAAVVLPGVPAGAGATIAAGRGAAQGVKAGQAGAFGALKGIKGDGLTAHHIPQAAAGRTGYNEGGALVMTQAEHTLTRTYGFKGVDTLRMDAGLSFRDVLAADIRDVRSIASAT